MNRYQAMVERVSVPEGQAERLKAAVLAAETEKRRPVFRHWSFGKKALLAALAVGLLAASGAALETMAWDPAFLERFGLASPAVSGAEGVFRDVNAVSVCGDVTLTVRQAIGDKKNLYILLDYQLPEDADLEAAEAGAALPARLGRGNLAWEDIRDTDPEELRPAFLFEDGAYSLFTRYLGYDPESRTLRYLLSADLMELSPLRRLLNPPITLLALPPEAESGEETVPLTDRAAVVSFRPSFDADTVSGTAKTEDAAYWAEMSPLSLQLRVKGTDLPGMDMWDFFENSLALRFRDGTVVPSAELEPPGGDSGGQGGRGEQHWNVVFGRLIDLAEVEAVLVGDVEIPVS